jgi:hypothetical protein
VAWLPLRHRRAAERLAEDERACGDCVVELVAGQVIAVFRFDTTAPEVIALTALAGWRWLELIRDDESSQKNCFVVPDAVLADVTAALRAPANPTPRAAVVGGEQSEPRRRP